MVATAAAWLCGQFPPIVRGQDVSPLPILQWFECRHSTIQKRIPDLFMAGYGAIWIPPPGRADSGNQSVGYDPYDRFDLGTPASTTLYGTETQLKTVADLLHRAGCDLHIDLVWNHSGFSTSASVDRDGNSFVRAGDYPGFVVTLPGDVDGDYHSAFASGVLDGRLGNLIDIDHSKNHRFVRSPVPGFASNIPAGIKAAFGRLADVPNAANVRFYPDTSLEPIILSDPRTGEQGLRVYPFNLQHPERGVPVEENALGYLIRNAQWFVQVIGADGFRIDAAKNFDGWVLDFYDRAVYRSSPRRLLDGTTRHVFSYCEVYDSNVRFVQTFVQKTINPSDPGRIGANRDALDFPLYFSLHNNLSGNGLANDWRSVVRSGVDLADDGMQNGSAGVKFVSAHDSGIQPPQLDNVAYAYVLALPGNAVVYHNAHDVGSGRTFPIDGRGDALGGVFGNRLLKLIEIRNTHGRGNYHERTNGEKELLAFEREGSALVLLSNRLDPGYDSRILPTSFRPGTPLLELTGNAADPNVNATGDLPRLITVKPDQTVDVRFPRNTSPSGTPHNSGYLIYGLATPQAENGIELENVDHIDSGAKPNAATNGSDRLTDIAVIKANSFRVKMRLKEVILAGSVRDVDADGDNALLRVDGGTDINGNGRVDYTTPGTVTYGCEEFVDKKSPRIGPVAGDGEFLQTVDATKLGNGLHFLEVLAFRHRADGGPAVYSSFKRIVAIRPPAARAPGLVQIEPVRHVQSVGAWFESKCGSLQRLSYASSN
jgi:alpha-amylase